MFAYDVLVFGKPKTCSCLNLEVMMVISHALLDDDLLRERNCSTCPCSCDGQLARHTSEGPSPSHSLPCSLIEQERNKFLEEY